MWLDSTTLKVVEIGLGVLETNVSKPPALEYQRPGMAFKIEPDEPAAMERFTRSMVVGKLLVPQLVNMIPFFSTMLEVGTTLECLLGPSTIVLVLATGASQILSHLLMNTAEEKFLKLWKRSNKNL